MFEVDLGEVLDEVEAAGTPAKKIWADGRYKLEIVNANAGATQGEVKKPKLGLQWKVLDGPAAHIGETQWENVILNKDNKTSKRMFVERLINLGIDKEVLRTNPALEQLAEMVRNAVVIADVTNEPWKSDATKIEQRFKIIKLIDTDAPEAEDEGLGAVEDEGLFGDLG